MYRSCNENSYLDKWIESAVHLIGHDLKFHFDKCNAYIRGKKSSATRADIHFHVLH